MSINCPRCGNSIEQDFGVITCGQCHAVLFIDMEGQVQVSGEAPTEASAADLGADMMAPLPESNSIFPDPNLEPMPAEAASAEHFSFEPAPAVEALPAETAPAAPASFEPPPAEPLPPQRPVAPVPPPPLPKRFQTRPQAKMPPAANHESMVPPANPRSEGGYEILQSGNLDEVSQFGNTTQDFGALSYYVLIENIDTSAAREKLFEALSDDKFQWDPREVLLQIKKGRLELPQLNPVKASVLVKRLQDVPVKVSWKQKLL